MNTKNHQTPHKISETLPLANGILDNLVNEYLSAAKEDKIKIIGYHKAERKHFKIFSRKETKMKKLFLILFLKQENAPNTNKHTSNRQDISNHTKNTPEQHTVTSITQNFLDTMKNPSEATKNAFQIWQKLPSTLE